MVYWNAGVMGLGLCTLESILQLSTTPTERTLLIMTAFGEEVLKS